MKEIINTLHSGRYSCVIKSAGEVYTFSRPGVADLYDLVKNKPGFLDEALIADKVVGKAAAALMIIGKVQGLHADIISAPALSLLQDAGVETTFTKVVPIIRNRTNTDSCPLEKICCDELSAEAIFPLIENFINSLNK